MTDPAQAPPPLEPFGDQLWLVDGEPIRFIMAPFDLRMAVVRLDSGGLWVFSPVQPSDERFAALDALGPVEHIVAPNKLHSLYVGPFKQRYSNAQVWISPGFATRHAKLAARVDAKPLSCGNESPWADQIELRTLDGHRFLDEVFFFHRRSGALLVTDVIQRHVPDKDAWVWRMLKRVAGIYGDDAGMARDIRYSFGDKAKARVSFEDVLAWPIERLVVTHGACASQGAHSIVERAFAPLLDR